VFTVKQNPRFGNAVPVSGMKLKRGSAFFFYFFNIDLCSTLSMEISRRDLLSDMAEHRLSLKVTKIRTTPVLVSHSKPMLHSPNMGFVFAVFQLIILVLKGKA